MLRGHSRGVLFLVVASLLWSTDSLFRLSAVMQFDSLFVTFLENLIQMVFLLPWLLYRHSKNIFQLSRQEWLCAAVCGVMGAALALVFYTASFLYVNASLPVLLQKLEPIMVSCISYLVFREKFSRRFFFWSFVALVASILLSFPDFDFGFLDEVSNQRLRGVIYALIACFFWACAGIAGKSLLVKLDPMIAVFWRVVFGTIVLIILMYFSQKSFVCTGNWDIQSFSLLIYLAIFPGLIAMIFYYYGLVYISASIAGFLKLLYPVGTVILNILILHESFNLIQLTAMSVLLFSIFMLLKCCTPSDSN
jgi:drug/metabolite transporter (DMT)-like permease